MAAAASLETEAAYFWCTARTGQEYMFAEEMSVLDLL